LPRLAAKTRRRELLVELIDNAPAGDSPFARGLLAAGARIDYRGLVVRAPLASVPVETSEPEDDPETDDAS